MHSWLTYLGIQLRSSRSHTKLAPSFATDSSPQSYIQSSPNTPLLPNISTEPSAPAASIDIHDFSSHPSNPHSSRHHLHPPRDPRHERLCEVPSPGNERQDDRHQGLYVCPNATPVVPAARWEKGMAFGILQARLTIT